MDRDILIGVGVGAGLFVLLFVAVGLWIRSDLKKLLRKPAKAPRQREPPVRPAARPRPPRAEERDPSRWVISHTSPLGLPPLPPFPPRLPAIDFSRMDHALMQLQDQLDRFGQIPGFGGPTPISFETDGQHAFAVVEGSRYELQPDQENIIPLPDGSMLTITASSTEIRTSRTQPRPRTPAAPDVPPPVVRQAKSKGDTPKQAPTAWERLMNDDEAPCPTTTTSAPKTKG